MKNSNLFYFFFLPLLIGCKNEIEVSGGIYNEKMFLDSALNINNYKVVERIQENDSVYSIKGLGKNNYTLSGYISAKDSAKIRWWRLYKDENKLMEIEYLFNGEKNVRNQIIFFKSNQIDTLQSKYYTKRIFPNGNIEFIFYTPQFNFRDSEISTQLIYSFSDGHKNLDRQKSWLKKNGSHYSSIIEIPDSVKVKSIKGVLIEREINTSRSIEGLNQIFFEESIK